MTFPLEPLSGQSLDIDTKHHQYFVCSVQFFHIMAAINTVAFRMRKRDFTVSVVSVELPWSNLLYCESTAVTESHSVVVTHAVEVCGQVVADLLQLWEAADSLLLSLLLRFLFDLTLRGRGALDALIQRTLVLNQRRIRRVHMQSHRLLLLQRNAARSLCGLN